METTKFILHILNKMRILGHAAVTEIESVIYCSCTTGHIYLSLHLTCQLSIKFVNRWNLDYKLFYHL